MADLLNRTRRFGGNLLDAIHQFGTMQYAPGAMPVQEELAGEAAAAAKAQYDRNFRIARDQAIKQGAGWALMNDYGHAGATNAYQVDLSTASAQAAELKKRRDEETRRQKLHEYVQSATGLSEDQRSLVDALGPEAAQDYLLKQAFPDAMLQQNGALATFPGENGNMWVIMRDGTARDTGIRDDRMSSEQRTIEAYQNNPELLRTYGRKNFEAKYGAEAGRVQAKVEEEIPPMLQSAYRNINRLENLKSRIAQIPTDRLTGELQEMFSAELQAINSELTEMALRKIADLQNDGVRLTPITEHELAVLFSTSAQISNLPEANLQILQRQIDALMAILEEGDAMLRHIDSGLPVLTYRGSWYGKQLETRPLPGGEDDDEDEWEVFNGKQ